MRPRRTFRHDLPRVFSPPPLLSNLFQPYPAPTIATISLLFQSRRILADLLKIYANLTDYNLATRIDKFIAYSQHPSRLRENLHYLREIGDFGAHAMENDQGIQVDVTREEAEWTLKIVEDLFDYFIVSPEKDRLLREAMDKKLDQTGRKPIKKPPI